MARIDLPEGAIAERRSVRRRVVIAGLIGLGTVLFLVPGFFFVRQWRAEQLASRAVFLVESGQLSDGWERVRAARQIAPNDLAILRTAARIAEQVDLSLATAWWEEARELSGGNVEDIQGQVRVSLALQNWAAADRYLEDLRRAAGETVTYILGQVQLSQGRGEMVAAVEVARHLLIHEHAREEHHWAFVRAALMSPRQADNLEARQHLQHLVQTADPAFAREALRRFSALDELSAEELAFAIVRWQTLADSREDKLLALQLRLEQPDVSHDSTVWEAKDLFQLEDPLERVILGRWFNRHQLYEATLSVVPESIALTRRDLYLIRLDALALLDRWSAVQALLGQSRAPLQIYLEELFRMRSFYQTGDTGRARLAWERSLQAARREALQLRFLARYTAALGLTELTIEALWQMVEQPGMKRSAYENLLAIHDGRKESRKVLTVLERMRMDYPYDYAVLNDWAYYSLLCGSNMVEAVALTERLIELNPELLSHRMTRVLGYLRVGNPRQALLLVESLPVADWTQVSSSRWRALLGAVLAENGRRSEADTALRGIDEERLMPEERELLEAAGL